MQKLIIFFGSALLSLSIHAQDIYKFENVIDLDATSVISQGRTGTCWSFATTSYLESEIIRLTGKKIDLSEMYNVRNTYPVKAENYIIKYCSIVFLIVSYKVKAYRG
jgi:bleomycin hydrolase